MNHKKSNGLRKNGYVTAIFSFVCIAAVFAGLGLFQGGNGNKKDANPPANELNQNDGNKNAQMENQPEFERVDANKNAPSEGTAPSPENEKPKPVTSAAKESSPNAAEQAPDTQKPQIQEQSKANETPSNNQPDNTTEEEEEQSTGMDVTFTWPLQGEIVMDYSIDQAIYDVTLDQYRTNDNICIAAPEGTEVMASAGGTVEKVSYDSVNGKSVVIDHNNGWKTTYSQLQEDVVVKEGQQVAAGECIGRVASPTKYSVLLGDHLEFSVARNNESVDPTVALNEG